MTHSPADFVKTAYRTARHFGFMPLDAIPRPPRTQEQLVVQKAATADRQLDALHGALTSGTSTYFEQALHDGKPALFFSIFETPRTEGIALNLQIIGVKKSIAEALLIQTLRSLLRDLGYPHQSVRINSLGDHDSVTRYLRELGAYLKKRQEDMPPHTRELMKENIMEAFLHLAEQGHELCVKSPNPLEYLSDASRRHFREIIEHLDMTGTPYEIDPRLVGHQHCYADTLFIKTDVPAVGAVVMRSGKKIPARHVAALRRADIPSVFMVQLGFAPKIRCLMLLDTLKAADISVHQALVSDSLSEQLRQAEAYNVPFSLILGQKEFVENSIIVRDMRSRSQQNIPFDTLIPHLKRLLSRI